MMVVTAIPVFAQTETTKRPGSQADGPGPGSKKESARPRYQGRIELFEDESHRLTMPHRIKTADGANAKVVNVRAVTATELRISAMGIGTTKLTLLDENDQLHEYDISVQQNTGGLSQTLNKLFPHVKIDVVPIGGAVVLRGTATSS